MISIVLCVCSFLFGILSSNNVKKLVFSFTPFLLCISDSLLLYWDKNFPLRPVQILFAFYISLLLKAKYLNKILILIQQNKILKYFLLYLLIEVCNNLRDSNQYLFFCKLFLLNEYPKYFCAIFLSVYLLRENKLVKTMQLTALLCFIFLLFEICTSYNWLHHASAIYVKSIPEFASKLSLHFAPDSIKNGIYNPNWRIDGLVFPSRFSGFDGSPNTSAILMAAFGFFFLQIDMFNAQINFAFRSFLLFGTFLILLIGQTRAAIFSFIISICIYCNLNKKIVPIIITSLLFFVLFCLYNKYFSLYATSFLQSRVLTKNELVGAQRETAFKIIISENKILNKLFGFGGNIYSILKNKLYSNDISFFGLQYLTGGIVFVLSYILFLFLVIINFYKHRKNDKSSICFCCFLVLFLSSLTNIYNFSWIYLMLGLSFPYNEKITEK